MRKRFAILTLGTAIAVSVTGCGQKTSTAETTVASTAAESAEESAVTVEKTTAAAAEDNSRPEAVSPEDWEAMKHEPVFGEQLIYMYNGGACIAAQYLAEELGYYQEYGIDATYTQGNFVTDSVGTGKCMWGTEHIAQTLVPLTNGVNITFVTGAHAGCKSIFVPVDSDIKTAADLKGKKLAIHDGTGNSDHNISYRLIDEAGVDPTTEVEFLNIEDNAATIAALKNGEVDASIFSDYFVLANYKDELRSIASITPGEDNEGELCCVTAMNNDFLKENPVHAKYVVKAIKRAGQYARLHSEEAVQIMYDTDKMTGKQEDQQVFWDSLHFGLSDAYTEQSIRRIVDDYIRLGVITKKDLTTDDVMAMAWTNICPDEEIEGLTVGDPVEPENAVIPIEQKQ
ncbi:MAG: ABC transporter substrate-binding protein [Eubacteriales bacterium]|nr:ABC transporter substrate-binding protein [Eubacteriales bacterium]